MKIFPPLSEILCPPGLGPTALLWHHRFLLSAIVVLSAALTFAVLPAPPSTAPHVASAPDPAACTALVLANPSTHESPRSPRTALRCATSPLQPGNSITSGQALARTGKVLHDGQLTAADRAIRPPAQPVSALRATVFDPAGTRASSASARQDIQPSANR